MRNMKMNITGHKKKIEEINFKIKEIERKNGRPTIINKLKRYKRMHENLIKKQREKRERKK